MVSEGNSLGLVMIYFLYGLAFFSMGLAIILEGRRGSDERLRLALRPLAAFGLIHGLHEWMDMLDHAGLISANVSMHPLWLGFKLCLLSFSFLSLAGFGFSYHRTNLKFKPYSQVAPLLMAVIWGLGVFVLRARTFDPAELWVAANVWTRYSLGIPSALIASVGLVAQQRTFRKSGMAEFGRDSLTAALVFAWYGLVGQLFAPASQLSPVVNEALFFEWFHFPVQIFRAGLAIVAAISLIRLMRSFDAQIQREIAELQQAQLREAREREALRRQLLQRVVSAQEAERLRVARDLHDQTGQTLTAIGMGLSGLCDAPQENTEERRANLKRLVKLTDGALNELQRMISDLRPTHLDDLGLPAALRWYLGDIQEHAAKLDITFSLEGDAYALPTAVETALYRIVQESITNVLRHAQAEHVTVDLKYMPDQVRIEVHDDGIGMEMEKYNREGRPALGLLGMQERAALIGGEVVIQSRPEGGVYVLVSIPIEKEQNLSQEEEVEKSV